MDLNICMSICFGKGSYTKLITTFPDSFVASFGFGGSITRLLEQSCLISSGMLCLDTLYNRGHVDGMSLKWEPVFIVLCKGIRYQSQERQVYGDECPDNFEMEYASELIGCMGFKAVAKRSLTDDRTSDFYALVLL